MIFVGQSAIDPLINFGLFDVFMGNFGPKLAQNL